MMASEPITVEDIVALIAAYLSPENKGDITVEDISSLIDDYLAQGMNHLCPDSNHPHAIDLGLPSGTKWACCNVGASCPEGYGGYYAWGETEEKSYYDWESYKYYIENTYTCEYIGSDIAGTSYDVAHVKWGGSWRMPTAEQRWELLDNCSSEWTVENGVSGRRFTGPNGASVFLPAAGYRFRDDLYSAGYCGVCWSSSPSPSLGSDAYYLYVDSGYADWDNLNRLYGLSVRAVCP